MLKSKSFPARGALIGLAASFAAAAMAAEPEDAASPVSSPPTSRAPLVAQGNNGTFTPAIIKRRGSLSWPGDFDREAYVRIKLCVDVEGRVASTEVLPNGFHEKRFVTEALRYVSRLAFEPAKVNGVPVTACMVQPVSFFFQSHLGERTRGLKAAFRGELDKVTQMIRDKDHSGAHFHAEWMLKEKVTFQYEYGVLQASLAETYALTGNPHRAMEAAKQATARVTAPFPMLNPGDPIPPTKNPEVYMLPKEWAIGMLEMRMRLAAEQGLAFDALQAYYELYSFVKPGPDDPWVRLGKLLEEAVKGGGQMIGKIELGDRGSWSLFLSRRSFTVDRVQGRIDALELNCGDKVRTLAYVQDVTWQVPPSWQNCMLDIKGDPDTRLELVELADSE